MRILGIDPGSRLLGYGCIDQVGHQIQHVTHGTLKLLSPSRSNSLDERLLEIYKGLSQIIEEYRPQMMSIEKVFFAKNAVSALKLGQARGAAILTGKIHSLQIVEYSPTEVKQAVVGYGRADKDQVAKMIQLLVGAKQFETSDASDALALAICHVQMSRFQGVGDVKDPQKVGYQQLAAFHRQPARRAGRSLSDLVEMQANQKSREKREKKI
jgi:crossover junction endodeoxyribonuclease RuvC